MLPTQPLDYLESIGLKMAEHNYNYAMHNGSDSKSIEEITGISHTAIGAGLIIPIRFMQAVLIVKRAMMNVKNFEEKHLGLSEPNLDSIAVLPQKPKEQLFDHWDPFKLM